MSDRSNRVAETLRLAAEYIDIYGKATGTYREGRGAACAVGAIREISQDSKIYGDAVRVVRYRLGTHNVERWSDNHDQLTVVNTLYDIANEIDSERA